MIFKIYPKIIFDKIEFKIYFKNIFINCNFIFTCGCLLIRINTSLVDIFKTNVFMYFLFKIKFILALNSEIKI